MYTQFDLKKQESAYNHLKRRERLKTEKFVTAYLSSNNEWTNFFYCSINFIKVIPALFYFKISSPLRIKSIIMIGVFVAAVIEPICLCLSSALRRSRITSKAKTLMMDKGINKNIFDKSSTNILQAIAQVTKKPPIWVKISDFIFCSISLGVPLGVVAAYIPQRKAQISVATVLICALSIITFVITLYIKVNNFYKLQEYCEQLSNQCEMEEILADGRLQKVIKVTEVENYISSENMKNNTSPIPIITFPDEDQKNSENSKVKSK